MTYGQIRLHLTKALPGVDAELVIDWIQGRYTRILDALSWKRQETESVLQSPARYAIGTIAVTQGSAVITSDGTTPTVFTAAMTGRMIRVANQNEYYQFAYVSPTSGTFDRPYEAPTAAAQSYRIDQAIFLLPANCRILRQVTPLHGGRPLTRLTPGELNRRAPARQGYGIPSCYTATWDNFSDPPQLQIELYPVPDSPSPDSSDATISSTLSWAIGYIYEEADIDQSATSASLKPFVRPTCLLEGVKADGQRHLKDWTAADAYEREFDKLLAQMQGINAQQRGPTSIAFADHLKRQTHNESHRSVPWERGIPPGGWGDDD